MNIRFMILVISLEIAILAALAWDIQRLKQCVLAEDAALAESKYQHSLELARDRAALDALIGQIDAERYALVEGEKVERLDALEVSFAPLPGRKPRR